jgi:hypothetical protein
MISRYDKNGRYLSVVSRTVQVDGLTSPPMPSDADVFGEHEGAVEILKQYFDIENGVTVNIPDRPSDFHEFDYEVKQWLDKRELPAMKENQWTAIKAARDLCERAGFSWRGFVFDSDPVSQGKILTGAILAMSNQEFSVEWTLADNTVLFLDSTGMTEVSLALGQHIASVHEKGRALRARIDEALTREEVSAVLW